MNKNSLINIANFSPKSLHFPDAWMGHLVFAAWLIKEFKPKNFVELGTHSGNSYFSFCQAVLEDNLSTKCYAVDTWQGDEHAGYYDDDIFKQVDAYNQEHFSGFSRLLRMTFDDAAAYFNEKSIDLLHIDGMHTYEAVKHDFETWLPKLASGAIVLFHDTNVRKDDFGVWKLWEELQDRYPRNLEFTHSHGLGVLQIAGDSEGDSLEWLDPSSSVQGVLKDYFTALGERQRERYALSHTKKEVLNLSQTLAERDTQLAERDAQLAEREAQLESLLKSRVWRITAPLRAAGNVYRKFKPSKFFKNVVHRAWDSLPLSASRKQQLKKLIFTTASPVFKHTGVYQNWVKNQQIIQWNEPYQPDNSVDEYIPLTFCEPPTNNPVKLICFYLPQFHPIPENDKWWGEGFTEWTNVQPATAQFEGHYQPRIPGELGYYNLLDQGVQKRQVELAKLYGIGGFCFYFYWFAGKRLLETPIENYLQDSSLDLPFCLCWANENWSRRWDGLDSQILIAQQHSPEDDLAFIKHVARYMQDERYIRIDGKPLLVVYRPNLLPSAPKTAERWRKWCTKNGIGEIYLAYTQSFETVNPSTYGFDAAIEFPPNESSPPIVTNSVKPISDDFDCTVYEWRIFVENSKNYQKSNYTLFRGVCPAWDNTARRKNGSSVFINNTPTLYQRWLGNAIADTLENQTNPDERLIFVNAWNEWAEGAYLEPDERYGYAYLQATRNALEARMAEGRRKVLLVTHDCHPHGAQFLLLEIARELVRNGFLPAIVALDGGRLLDEFAQLGPMIVASSSSHGALCNFLADCRKQEYSNAITSTVVCGSIVPELKRQGFQVLSLIHELSGVIHAMKQESNAKHIAELSDRIVFPAKLVRDHYTTITPFNAEKAFIRPQGLLRKNPYQGKNREAHREVCQRHGFPINTRIILSIGFLDHRKGADLFVKIAAQVCHKFKDIVFIWVGHTEPNIERDVRNKIKDFNLQDRILLIGFDPEPFVYYAAASVYALTSREDPFPNVVLESASVGVPIVAFENTTGAAEFIVQQGGLLARHLDVAHFATHIETLLADQTKLPAHLSSDFSLRRYVLDLLHYLTASARISVIVPNYNYARLIKRRLDSIRMQTYPIYELIILDDASTDESVSRITDYCRKNDCDARVVLNKANSGSVFSQWQKGIRMATGDLVWIAEADDSSDPNFLSTLVPAFDENEIVLACCQSRQINEKGRLLATDYLSYTSDISRRWQNDHFSNGVDIIRESLSIKNVIPNVSGVLFDRQALVQALENIGEDLFDYRVAGDWLVYLHVLVQGRFFFSSKSLNDHCRHTQSVTCDAAVEKHLDEVAKLQTIAQKIAQPDEFVIAQAHEYLEQLRVQFGLDKIQDQKES